MSTTTTDPLPNPNRIITTTNPTTGISTFDHTLPSPLPVIQDLGGTHFRLAYVSHPAPLSLTHDVDIAAYAPYLASPPPLVLPGGAATVWYIDTPPGASSPLHRTVSLDFVFVVAGELVLTMESGETRAVGAGDMVVQRGTMHSWRNPSGEVWARMIGVMAECRPVVLDDGTQLGAVGVGGKH